MKSKLRKLELVLMGALALFGTVHLGRVLLATPELCMPAPAVSVADVNERGEILVTATALAP